MLIRIFSLVLCLATIVACAISVYDLPGWQHMATDFKVVLGIIGGIATSILGFLVLVSEDDIIRMNQNQQLRARRASLSELGIHVVKVEVHDKE